MNYKFKYTDKIVGFFVFTAILIVILTLLSITINRKIFIKKYTFKTQFMDAVGLVVDAPINFKGYEIGRIKDFQLNNDNFIDATFEVYQPYRNKIVHNSVLRKTTGLINGKVNLELYQGPDLNSIAKEGSLIPELETPIGKLLIAQNRIKPSGEVLTNIASNLNRFIYNLNQDNNADEGAFFRMLFNMANASDNMNESLASLKITLANLNKDNNPEAGTIFRTLNNLSEVSEQLKTTVVLVNQTISATDTLVKVYSQSDGLITKMVDPKGDKFVKPIQTTIQNINNNLMELNQIIKYINKQTPEISTLLSDTKSTLNTAEKTLSGINNNPLIKGGITQPKPLQPKGGKIRPREN